MKQQQASGCSSCQQNQHALLNRQNLQDQQPFWTHGNGYSGDTDIAISTDIGDTYFNNDMLQEPSGLDPNDCLQYLDLGPSNDHLLTPPKTVAASPDPVNSSRNAESLEKYDVQSSNWGNYPDSITRSIADLNAKLSSTIEQALEEVKVLTEKVADNIKSVTRKIEGMENKIDTVRSAQEKLELRMEKQDIKLDMLKFSCEKQDSKLDSVKDNLEVKLSAISSDQQRSRSELEHKINDGLVAVQSSAKAQTVHWEQLTSILDKTRSYQEDLLGTLARMQVSQEEGHSRLEELSTSVTGLKTELERFSAEYNDDEEKSDSDSA
ncbi:hypothetical protein F5884DRAFT_905852 [Xylogone sp. PMI_703]|nr:hypothetical protein F5884DRAFT_905852 [Xylogone sp. PMI_703]